ncbi:hypothetical protein ACVWY0_003057 [Arthrobacter sp. UYNi723]
MTPTSQPEPRLASDAAVFVRPIDGAVFAAQKGTPQAEDLANDASLTPEAVTPTTVPAP